MQVHKGDLNMLKRKRWSTSGWLLMLGLALLLAACSTPAAEPDPPVEAVADTTEPVEAESVETENTQNVVDTSRYDEFEIITLLPPDAIPAIDNPTFHTADEADDFYDPDELVMGVVFNGDARAYSVPHLSSHEIVNDEVGGVKIAVTW